MALDLTKHDHFKLYVLLEDSFIFESELIKNNLEFYSNYEEQINTTHSIRYYLKDEDRIIIDKIITENNINSGIEGSGLTRYNFNKKPLYALALITAGVISALVLIRYLFYP